MEILHALKNDLYVISEKYVINQTLLSITEKYVKFYDKLRVINDNYNVLKFLKDIDNEILVLKKEKEKSLNKKREILNKIETIEIEIINKNNVNNKLELNFIIYKSITNDNYLNYNKNINWNYIKIIYENNKNRYFNDIININILYSKKFKHSITDIKKISNDYLINDSKLLNDIIYLFKIIANKTFFDNVIIMNGKFIVISKEIHSLIKPLPYYFESIILYYGEASFIINKKIHRFINPTSDIFKPHIKYIDYCKIIVI